MKKVQFNPVHLALPWKEFAVLFAHLPKAMVKEAWEEANPKAKKKKTSLN